MPSFDVVSEVDTHELTNAIDQANRELATRFDFKGTAASIEIKDKDITLIGDEPERPYSRMAIPYLLTEKISEEGTHLRKGHDHYDSKGIRVLRDRVPIAGGAQFLGWSDQLRVQPVAQYSDPALARRIGL
mgnify:CR=1 FL=1